MHEVTQLKKTRARRMLSCSEIAWDLKSSASNLCSFFELSCDSEFLCLWALECIRKIHSGIILWIKENREQEDPLKINCESLSYLKSQLCGIIFQSLSMINKLGEILNNWWWYDCVKKPKAEREIRLKQQNYSISKISK